MPGAGDDAVRHLIVLTHIQERGLARALQPGKDLLRRGLPDLLPDLLQELSEVRHIRTLQYGEISRQRPLRLLPGSDSRADGPRSLPSARSEIPRSQRLSVCRGGCPRRRLSRNTRSPRPPSAVSTDDNNHTTAW